MKADFIRAKHQMLSFIIHPYPLEDALPSDTGDEASIEDRAEEEASQELHSSVRTGNLETSLRLLSQGANPNYYHKVSRRLTFLIKKQIFIMIMIFFIMIMIFFIMIMIFFIMIMIFFIMIMIFFIMIMIFFIMIMIFFIMIMIFFIMIMIFFIVIMIFFIVIMIFFIMIMIFFIMIMIFHNDEGNDERHLF